MAEKTPEAPPPAGFQTPQLTAEQMDALERERQKTERRNRKKSFAAALGPEFVQLTQEEMLRELWPQIVRAFKLGYQFERVAQICKAQRPPVELTKAKWDSIPQFLIDQEERRKKAKEKAASKKKR